MSNTGFGWSALPDRRVVIGSLVGALATGALFGLVIGIVSPIPTGAQNAASVAGATSPTSVPPSTTASPATSASPSATTKPAKLRTRTRTAAPVPQGFIQQPSADRTLTLYKLQSIDDGDHDHIRLSVIPGRLLKGAQAAQHYAQKGEPAKDVAVEAIDGQDAFDLDLSPDAALWGQSVLGGDGENPNPPRQFGLDEFLGVVHGALDQGRHPAIWVKRSLGTTSGPVIYLAEQFPA
jgi:hypothetical protein